MDKKLSPKFIKYFVTSIIAIVASLLIIMLFSYFSDRIIVTYHNGYTETSELAAEGYAKLAEERVLNYKNQLEAFYDEEIFSKGSTTSIILHISHKGKELSSDFVDVFYFDENGVSTDIHGVVRDVRKREYFTALMYSGAKNFYTGAEISMVAGVPVFIIARAVYDAHGKFRGGLCGTIKLDAFGESFYKINVLGKGDISIIDKYGRFVINKDPQLLSKTFVPKNPDLRMYSSESIAKIKSGSIVTENPYGEMVSLIFRPIHVAGWIMCVSLPADTLIKAYKERLMIRSLMVFFALIVIFLLFFGELKLIDFFQKKEFLFMDYDSITGLWSQDRFEHEADKHLRRRGKSKFMLIDCDILGYKYIGQNHGENELKKLIRFVAKVIDQTAQKHNGICCHGSSDHFYLFFKISSVKNAMKVFKEYARENLSVTDNYKIPFNLKFGIAFLLPEDKYQGLTISTLIGQASIAKKNLRKETDILYSIYDAKFLRHIQEEYFLESQCEKALKNREFFVLYQPKISLKDEKIIGAEALVRWQHPERGVIPPNDFIPLFERTGFVTKVDFFVFEEVLKFLDARIKAGLPVVQISVNMSRNHNKPERFMEDFLEIFNKYNVPSKYIQVEILERSFSENRILAQITDLLHQNGFTVAMDDFGTGESSLSMLTQVPIDVLKFDRSFLLSSTNSHGEIDRRSAGFIESFIGLSKRLDKEVVFEGVETESQRDFLRVIDCDTVQGYFYSRPLSQKDFESFIENHY